MGVYSFLNRERRDRLRDAMKMLSNVSSIVERVCDEEQDCMDNYPENLQGTDRFERMEAAVDSLNDALEKIDEAKDCIQSAVG